MTENVASLRSVKVATPPCAALICKAAKKKLGKKVLAVIGAAAFVGAILAVILIARTPMPL